MEEQIKASELRIGNYVYTKDNFVVKSYSPEGLFNILKDVEKGNIKPVPLTEQWLIDFGWKYLNGRTDGELTMDTPCKMDIDFINNKMQIKSHYQGYHFYKDLRIEYVHQLQNLIFALTGEELTLKKEP